MIVGCTGNYRKPEYLDIVKYISDFLIKNNSKCIVSSDLLNLENVSQGEISSNLEIVDFSEIEKQSDIILCIGGDGTLLSTARRLKNNKTPILGIHIGGLGFLAQVMKENLSKSLKCILNKDYVVEKRMRLKLTVVEHEKSNTFTALNDIVVDHGESGRILKTKIQVDDDYLNTYENKLVNVWEYVGAIEESTGLYFFEGSGRILFINDDRTYSEGMTEGVWSANKNNFYIDGFLTPYTIEKNKLILGFRISGELYYMVYELL